MKIATISMEEYDSLRKFKEETLNCNVCVTTIYHTPAIHETTKYYTGDELIHKLGEQVNEKAMEIMDLHGQIEQVEKIIEQKISEYWHFRNEMKHMSLIGFYKWRKLNRVR